MWLISIQCIDSRWVTHCLLCVFHCASIDQLIKWSLDLVCVVTLCSAPCQARPAEGAGVALKDLQRCQEDIQMWMRILFSHVKCVLGLLRLTEIYRQRLFQCWVTCDISQTADKQSGCAERNPPEASVWTWGDLKIRRGDDRGMTHSFSVNRAGYLNISLKWLRDSLALNKPCNLNNRYTEHSNLGLLAHSVGQLFLGELFSAYGISLLRLVVCALSFHLSMLLI